jgi:hypothetical protein
MGLSWLQRGRGRGAVLDPPTQVTTGDPAGGRRRLGRRQVLGGAAVTAVGVSLLGPATASPAAAATTGALAPTVVALEDAPEISVDASAGNDFRVTLSASRIMTAPVNATAGQQIVFQVTQGPAGSCVLIWATGYQFPGSTAPPTLSTAAGQTDLIGFVYDASSQA